MLEVKNLTKIYKGKKSKKSKKNNDVIALDDVNIHFEHSGMVFLLGKSGSGKSTLLNLCGGLDEPTSGEIIVKGRSSKGFKNKDFDCYRNTYVGFVFQEYNILNEFSVEDNIAIALELQGKSKDKDNINKILEEVDLIGYEKRKPNTLSGGQKQRIAIARALIKDPEIIMADEPTGALDSNTGRQVLETLKKLSKDKLVIVVSHDREFASTYADRIIELKDGKVISDVSKTYEDKKSITSNIDMTDDVVSIKNSSSLNQEDYNFIKDFLSKSDGEILIVRDKNDISNFKQVNKISDSFKKETFKHTDESKLQIKKYSKKDSQFIKSRLPLRHAIKIGLSGLKHKPFRLFNTIMLCTIAFVMFGVITTMTFYDNEQTFKETLKTNPPDYVKLYKAYKVKAISYVNDNESTLEYDNHGYFTNDEFQDYKKDFGNKAVYAYGRYFNFEIVNPSEYYKNEINYLSVIKSIDDFDIELNGNIPNSDNEIVISSYIADSIINNKLKDNDKVLEFKSHEELIGKSITFDNKKYKIVGIFNSGIIDSKYDALKEKNNNYSLSYEYEEYLDDSIHQMVFLNENEYNKIVKNNISYDYSLMFEYHLLGNSLKIDNKYDFAENMKLYYGGYSFVNDNEALYFNKNKVNLNDDEILVTKSYFVELLREYYEHKNNLNYSDNTQEILNKIYNLNSTSIYDENGEIYDDIFLEKKKILNELINIINNDKVDLTVGFKYNEFDENEKEREFKVVGIWDNKENYFMEYRVIFNDNISSEIWNLQIEQLKEYSISTTNYDFSGDISTIFVPFNNNKNNIDKLWGIYSNRKFDSNSSRLTVGGRMFSIFKMIDSFIEELYKIFVWAALILAGFGMALLSNFIAVSITYKKKEIGILRAVGARGMDVFKIFFCESLFITILCIIFAILINNGICTILNKEVYDVLNAAIFVFGIKSVVVLGLLSFISCVIATFLPVYLAARRKPVETIRST